MERVPVRLAPAACVANFVITYGQSVSGGAPSCATDLIPSRISAPESWAIVPSIARSL